MIDIERITEQLLVNAEVDQSNSVIRKKIELELKLILDKQCEDIQDIIHKYENQWEQTSGNIYKTEESEPTARLIRLLFSLIKGDINQIANSYRENA